jgi:hypothetical protein
VLLALMAAVGLFLFRCVIARPVGATEEDRTLRAVTIAGFVAVAAGLVLVPVYLLLSTAKFAARSALDVGALVPLARLSSFGRGISDLEVAARAVRSRGRGSPSGSTGRTGRGARSSSCSRSARPPRAPRRCCSSPGSPATPAQTSPARARARARLGAPRGRLGLARRPVGLLVLWSGGAARAADARARDRRAALLARRARRRADARRDRDAPDDRAPATLGALWETGYGRAISVKIGLLGLALVLGAVNLLVTTPRLARAGAREDPALGGARRAAPAAHGLGRGRARRRDRVRRRRADEPAAAGQRARPGAATRSRRVGPGRCAAAWRRRARARSSASSRTRGAPMGFGRRPRARRRAADRRDRRRALRHARHGHGPAGYKLARGRARPYRRNGMPLLMVGNWGVTFEVTPPAGAPYSFVVVDQANG